jgi:ribulose kinase
MRADLRNSDARDFERHFAPETSFDALNEAASALETGAGGLVVLDHFQGNRTPYTGAASRGAITGLTLKHTPSHVFHAIMESICLGTRLIIDSLEKLSPRSASWLRVEPATLHPGFRFTPTRLAHRSN